VVEDSGQWADSYVHQASLAPLLRREEALVLARRVHQGDAEAKSDLIAANRRLVVSIARRHASVTAKEGDWKTRTMGDPPDPERLAPLLAKGEQGLRVAVDRFDESKGFSFPTYATWWIGQAIAEGNQGDDPGGVREPLSPGPGSLSGAVAFDLPTTRS
jgi:RNA polymerase primary sigma factor